LRLHPLVWDSLAGWNPVASLQLLRTLHAYLADNVLAPMEACESADGWEDVYSDAAFEPEAVFADGTKVRWQPAERENTDSSSDLGLQGGASAIGACTEDAGLASAWAHVAGSLHSSARVSQLDTESGDSSGGGSIGPSSGAGGSNVPSQPADALPAEADDVEVTYANRKAFV